MLITYWLTRLFDATPRGARRKQPARRRHCSAAEVLEARLYLTTYLATVDSFNAQPLPVEVAAGQEFAFYNDLGGDRGEVKPLGGGGEVDWNVGNTHAYVTQNGGFAGQFTSVFGLIRDGQSMDFGAVHPSEILPAYQPQVDALIFTFSDGVGPVTFKLESPAKDALWTRTEILTGGPREFRFTLPANRPDDVQAIVVTVDGNAGNFYKLDEMQLELDAPDLGNLEPALWSAAELLGNFDRNLKIARDRRNFPAADFANIPVTGGTALAATHMAMQGIIPHATAVDLVQDVTATYMAIPKHGGLMPHFVKHGPGGFQIVPNTEYSSVDTIIGLTFLLEARDLAGLSTQPVEDMFRAINWDDLTLPSGLISHGYTDGGQLLPSGWDVWGSESFLAVWARAASRPDEPLAALTFTAAQTWDGAQFNDELAALAFPLEVEDVWGNDWGLYRPQAAFAHTQVYAGIGAPIGVLSPAEVAEPWTVPADKIYQAFGRGGYILQNDGLALTGHLHAAPHGLGLIATHEPQYALDAWEFLKDKGVLSPINVVESLYLEGAPGSYEVVANPLKSGWNLLLQTLGWQRYVMGNTYGAYQAAQRIPFIADGLARLLPGNPPSAPALIAPVGVAEQTTPQFQWSPVAGADRYDVWVNVYGSNELVFRDQNVTGTTLTSPVALDLEKKYIWTVRAVTSNGTGGDWASHATFTVQVDAGLDAPANLLPTGTAPLIPTFAWSNVAGADRYDVWVNVRGSNALVFRNTNVHGNGIAAPSALVAGREYIWAVRALTADGAAGPWAPHATFVALPQGVPPAGAPVLTSPTGTITDTTPQFAWTAVAGAAHYDLWLNVRGSNELVIRNQNINGTTFTPATPLASETPYIWTVRAISADGTPGTWASHGTFDLIPAPAPPASVPSPVAPVGNVAGPSPTFEWTAVAGATRYDLWVNVYGSNQLVLRKSDLTTNEFVSPVELAAGQSYIWTVRAFVGNAVGDWAPHAIFRVAGAGEIERLSETQLGHLDTAMADFGRW